MSNSNYCARKAVYRYFLTQQYSLAKHLDEEKMAQVNLSGPKTFFSQILGTFKIKNLATSNFVKDWGKSWLE